MSVGPKDTAAQLEILRVSLSKTPHAARIADEPLKLSDEYLSICRKFDEARIICGYPVPTPAETSAAPSFGPDWEQCAREHCRSIDILLAANAQRQKRIDTLEAENATLRAERAGRSPWLNPAPDSPRWNSWNSGPGGPYGVSDILSSAMRGHRPLDPYGR